MNFFLNVFPYCTTSENRMNRLKFQPYNYKNVLQNGTLVERLYQNNICRKSSELDKICVYTAQYIVPNVTKRFFCLKSSISW